MKKQRQLRIAHFPLFSNVRTLVSILPGVQRLDVRHMITDIKGKMGTPQHNVNWTDPDTWIDQRLSGTSAVLARRIWSESRHSVNPRHMHGMWLFIEDYRLLADNGGILQITGRGSQFIESNKVLIRELDSSEGLLDILGMVEVQTPARRGDLLPYWTEYLRGRSPLGSPSTIRTSLATRLLNLIERGLVLRDENEYAISPTGLEYGAPAHLYRMPAPNGQMSSKTSHTKPQSTKVFPEGNSKHAVFQAVQSFNVQQKNALRELLVKMDPYRFEHLVSNLLEAMGYEDVEVTKECGDMGVDVIGTVQVGITTVKEVVQVKRHQGSISRPVLDQLRGALPYHSAIRGTLITIGEFSKGCSEAALFPGAAPITLIDGDKLLDLLVEHEIGVRKQPTVLLEIDEACINSVDDETPEPES